HHNKSQQAVKKEMLKHLHGRKVDTWIMLGDNAYTDGTQEQYNRGMFNAYPEMFKTNVLWSVIGNHDAHRLAYYDIMEFPTHGASGGTASGSEKYYACEQGNVHFVMLDSQTADRSADGDMARWLERDLKANTKLWTVAVFHHPPYTKGTHDSDRVKDSGGRMVQMREHIVPILEKYDVDLVLSGHSHVYERSDLMHGHYGYSNTFDPSQHVIGSETNDYAKCKTKTPQGGTLYIVAGASSAGRYGINPFSRLHPAMKLGYFTDGSLLLRVKGERLRGEYVTNEGTVLDRFSLVKRSDCR
ncbi:MAG: metallophosphoesterase, partial [Campylobacterales bacterium]